MSLSDTAEYWWDIKNRPYKHTFTHIKGVDCGHFHVHETQNVNDIDCYACIKLIDSDQELKTNLIQITNDIVSKEIIKKEKKLFYQKQRLADKAKYGLCSCGYPFVKRENRISLQSFLGCYNYPNCKQTKSL